MTQDFMPPVTARLALLAHLQKALILESLMPIPQSALLHSLLQQLRSQVKAPSTLRARLRHGFNTQRQAARLLSLYLEAARYAWWAEHKEVIPELLSLAEAAWEYTDRSQSQDHLRTDFARFTQQQQKQRFHEALQQLQDP